ncbi:hypothetical protein K438DRAFT_1860940 [Mycena galopus ATCC 62051]|nr:hypothetical protein K438DRAFT_1860940 [Mycena galopus ATCC 62051]
MLLLQGELGAARTRCEELAAARDSQRQNAEAMARTAHGLEVRIAALEQSRRDERTKLDVERAEMEALKVALSTDRKQLQREQEQLKRDKCACGADSQLVDAAVSTRKRKRTEAVSSPHPGDEICRGSHVAGSSESSISDSSSSSPTTGPVRSGAALFADLAPKTHVCIGQLSVTAHVPSPIPYLFVSTPAEEWAPVRLHHGFNPGKGGAGAHVLHLLVPAAPRTHIPSEAFGLVEQKVALALGPLLERKLIGLDAKIRRGLVDLPTPALQLLVYTPKGNIPTIAKYLRECALLLDDLSPGSDRRYIHYHNPRKSAPDEPLAREGDEDQ